MKDLQVKEIVYQAVQATKSENSGLILNLKSQIAVLETHYSDIKETLDRIETQTTKTNGRVSILEIGRSNDKGWIAGFGVSVMIVVSLIIYIFNTSLNKIVAQESETRNLLQTHITK